MNQSSERKSAPQTFGTLPVDAPMARSLRAMSYQQPTPVQEQTIPLLRQRKDVLAQAQTGTGKTAGFGIPLIESIQTYQRTVQAIVLVPTRELCLQVADELRRLGSHSAVSVIAVYGGVGLTHQIQGLRRGAHAVVGTPGRVEDLLQRGTLQLDKVHIAVLDEADRMLDVGFLPAIERILRRTPSARQTALFSATIPAEVRGLAQRHMRDAVTVEIDPQRPAAAEIDQRFQRVADGDKLAALRTHLDDPACYLALVFRRTTHRVDRLARELSRHGYKVGALHGRRSQHQRERVLAGLQSGTLQALIATDIAARGLDIASLTHVFNYDLPDTPETYVHRIGRTGRAGETGTAITFVTPEDELALRQIERYLATRRREDSPGARHPHSATGGNGAGSSSGSGRAPADAGSRRRDRPSSPPRSPKRRQSFQRRRRAS